jgi:hypothetical protein
LFCDPRLKAVNLRETLFCAILSMLGGGRNGRVERKPDFFPRPIRGADNR